MCRHGTRALLGEAKRIATEENMEMRPMSKKFFVPLVAVALLAAACGGGLAPTSAPLATSGGASPSPSTAPSATVGGPSASPSTVAVDCGSANVTLTFLNEWGGSQPSTVPLQDALAGFAKLCPNITVQPTFAADTASEQTQYETAKLANQEPDVVLASLFAKSVAWLANGATVDVTPYVDSWGLKSIIDPAALAQWTTSDGKVQAFPYEGFTWPVWYNMSILQKAGISEIPKTTDELIADAAKIRAAGFQPLATGGKDWSGTKLFAEVVDTYLNDAETAALYTKGNWDDPKVKAGVDEFVRLRDAKVFSDSTAGFTVDNMDTSFFGGKAAMMDDGSWSYDATPATLLPSVTLGGFPLPAGAARPTPVVYTGYSSDSFWISPNGAQKLAAVQAFITYFYTPKVAGNFVAKGEMVLPLALNTLPVDQGKLNPLYVQAATTVAAATTTVPISDLYVPAAVESAFERATSSAYVPGTSADAIIQALDQAWQQ